MAKLYRNFYEFHADYEKKVHDYYFSEKTLKFFGEALGRMRLLKDTIHIVDNMGETHEVYVISSYQRNAPKGMKSHYHYFDVETLENVQRKTR